MANNQEAALKDPRDLIISGNVWKSVWFLAWPTAITTLIQTAYNVINRMFIGRIDAEAEFAMAAVGIGGTVLMIQFALMLGLAVGTSALAARFIGAEQYEDADESIRQSILLCFVGGIITSLPLIIWASPIVEAVGAKGKVVNLATEYTAIIAYSSVPMFLIMVITSALRSAGDVKRPLYASAIILGINAILDYFLIFGVSIFPQLGIKGAAIATNISRLFGTALLFYFLKKSLFRGSMSHFRPRIDWFARVLNIGWPAMFQHLLWTTAYAGFIKILSFLPDAVAAQAAVTIAITIESFAFMPGVAYSQAATPLVGQNLGASNPGRAAHSAWVATGQAVTIMSIVAVLFLVVPKQLAYAFTKEAAVAPLVVSYLRVNAVGEPFLALAMVLKGALQGAGDTRAPAWITFISSWMIRLPLTWLLAITLGYNAFGAWLAMCATTIFGGILMVWWFQKGKWQNIAI